jgi:glyoxylase-like metal-dependent hydrolase (beta-lactamase superfamily II)
MDVPAMFAVIEHPEQGLILWDTGYAPRFREATRRLPWRVMRWITPMSIEQREAAVEQVKALGYGRNDVRMIILSHFDPDHFGGLKDFPDARIVCSWRAWEAVRSLGTWGKLKARLLPGHLPEDMAGRLWLLPDFNGPPISVFESSMDLFGDGSLRLVDLPGHAPGQMGAFVRRKSDGADLFLAADACWNLASLEAAGYRGGAHRLIAVDKKAQDETYKRLRKLHEDWPSLRIVPAHCPRAWRETADAGGKVGA